MDKQARKEIEKALFILCSSDMEIMLFNTEKEIKHNISLLSDKELLNTLYNYMD